MTHFVIWKGAEILKKKKNCRIKVFATGEFNDGIILTLFPYLTTHPLTHEDAKEDPNGTMLHKAEYLRKQRYLICIAAATGRESNCFIPFWRRASMILL